MAAQEFPELTYPGGHQHWRDLDEHIKTLTGDEPNYVGLVIAREIAGLAYCVDKIAYQARVSKP